MLLARPLTVARAVSGEQPPAWVIRALGARLLAQGLAEALRPDRRTLQLGVAVDTAHALSMLPAAWLLPRYRRSALASAASSAVSAAIGAVTARSG